MIYKNARTLPTIITTRNCANQKIKEIYMFKSLLKKFLPSILRAKYALKDVSRRYDMELHSAISTRQSQHPNTFMRYGKKCFSQNDEDGLTLEILNRLGIENGVFVEYGVGDGFENNTLILLSLGWKGIWIGGESLSFETSKSKRLSFYKEWVTKENVASLALNGLRDIQYSNPDVISFDLDGNDLYFCKELLDAGLSPSLFIVEINAKFPIPVRFSIDYNPAHNWDDDDYHGASLMSFVDLFTKFGYSLVCVNAASGHNAFFVKSENIDKFPEIPEKLEDLWIEPYFYQFRRHGEKKSIKLIQNIINRS